MVCGRGHVRRPHPRRVGHNGSGDAFGQLPFFIDSLKQAGLFDAWVANCPLWLINPNAPRNRELLGSVLLSVLAGHRRYAHITSLRCDPVNPTLHCVEPRAGATHLRCPRRTGRGICNRWESLSLSLSLSLSSPPRFLSNGWGPPHSGPTGLALPFIARDSPLSSCRSPGAPAVNPYLRTSGRPGHWIRGSVPPAARSR